MSSIAQEVISGPGWVAEPRQDGTVMVYPDYAAGGDPILDALRELFPDCLDEWMCTALPCGAWYVQPVWSQLGNGLLECLCERRPQRQP